MPRQVFSLNEAVSAQGHAALTVSTSISVGDQNIEHGKTIATRLPDESFIAPFLKLVINEIFAELIEKVQDAELTTGSAHFNLTAELNIGAASALVERKVDDTFPLETISHYLVTVSECLASTLLFSLADFKTLVGLVWDNQSSAHVLGPNSAIYGLEDEVESMLADLLGLRSYGSRVFVVTAEGGLDEVPADAYRCNCCGKCYSTARTVEVLKVLQQDGRIPKEYLKCFPISVLNAFAQALGGYWNTETEAVQRIPEGRYPDGAGALADIPEGHFWNAETYSLEPIKTTSE